MGRWLLLLMILAGGGFFLTRAGGPLEPLWVGLKYRAAQARKRPADTIRPLFADTFTKALLDAGIDTTLIRVEWMDPDAGPDSSAEGGVPVPTDRWEVPLPPGFDPGVARDLTETIAERFGGRLTSEDSPDTSQVFLTARFLAGFDVEVLFLGKEPRPDIPRIALVIDDFGYRNLAESEQILLLGPGLTMAILPFTTGAEDLANRCREKGMEVILNLPMEGLDYPRVDPGEGAILVDTPPGEIRKRVLDGFNELGGARGAMTHYGQLVVEDPDVIQVVLETIATKSGYFIDTTPTPYSQVAVRARALGVSTIQLRENLDGRSAPESAVRKNLEELAERARRKGRAAGLVHPYPATVAVLRELLPAWRAAGIEIIPFSEYLESLPAPQ